jgi:hypothetical protein
VKEKHQQALAASKETLNFDPKSTEADNLAGQAEFTLGD